MADDAMETPAERLPEPLATEDAEQLIERVLQAATTRPVSDYENVKALVLGEQAKMQEREAGRAREVAHLTRLRAEAEVAGDEATARVLGVALHGLGIAQRRLEAEADIDALLLGIAAAGRLDDPGQVQRGITLMEQAIGRLLAVLLG